MKRLVLILSLLASAAWAQNLLPSGGIAVSCNAVTASTSANPGAAGGCTAFALVTSGGSLPSVYTWQVITTGSPASVTVTLQGSLDGVTWSQVDTTSSATTKTVTNNAYKFLGCIPSTLSGGSSPTVTCQISVSNTSGGGSGSLPAGLSFSAPTLTVSTAGSGNGQLALSGNTSGTATLTAPAVAGTTTNALASSNSISVPAGTQAAAALQVANANTGLYSRTGNLFDITANNQTQMECQSATNPFCYMQATGTFGWTSNLISNGLDTGIGRGAAGVLIVGNGTQGDITGTIESGKYATGTNCSASGTAANPSVASCGSSAAGSFACATAASTGTCQVNTTAVTVNSEIFITQRTDTTTGTRLSVTCNTTVDTVQRVVTAVTAATSFTINLGTISTNPECFSYYIIN